MRTLPAEWYAAYNWTVAAGELGELRALDGDALTQYVQASAANSLSNGDGDVTEGDLRELASWLRDGGA